MLRGFGDCAGRCARRDATRARRINERRCLSSLNTQKNPSGLNQVYRVGRKARVEPFKQPQTRDRSHSPRDPARRGRHPAGGRQGHTAGCGMEGQEWAMTPGLPEPERACGAIRCYGNGNLGIPHVCVSRLSHPCNPHSDHFDCRHFCHYSDATPHSTSPQRPFPVLAEQREAQNVHEIRLLIFFLPLPVLFF